MVITTLDVFTPCQTTGKTGFAAAVKASSEGGGTEENVRNAAELNGARPPFKSQRLNEIKTAAKHLSSNPSFARQTQTLPGYGPARTTTPRLPGPPRRLSQVHKH